MEDSICYRRKVTDCLLSGDINDAIQNLERAVAIAPDDDLLFETYRSIMDIATDRFSSKGDYSRAIDIYDKVVESNLEFTQASFVRHSTVLKAYQYRGSEYVKKGEISRGIEDFDQLIELFNPSYDPYNHNAFLAYLCKANAYENVGEYDRAIENYGKILEKEPVDFDIFCSVGDIYLAKGQFNQAMEYYDKAIEVAPDFPGTHIAKGKAYAEREEYAIAIENYNKAIEILQSQEMDPDYPDFGFALDYVEVHNLRGLAHYNNADYSSALSDANIVLDCYAQDNLSARILRDAASHWSGPHS